MAVRRISQLDKGLRYLISAEDRASDLPVHDPSEAKGSWWGGYRLLARCGDEATRDCHAGTGTVLHLLCWHCRCGR
jgi:hypothetical protein